MKMKSPNIFAVTWKIFKKNGKEGAQNTKEINIKLILAVLRAPLWQ
jgi:hypothetical protein